MNKIDVSGDRCQIYYGNEVIECDEVVLQAPLTVINHNYNKSMTRNFIDNSDLLVDGKITIQPPLELPCAPQYGNLVKVIICVREKFWIKLNYGPDFEFDWAMTWESMFEFVVIYGNASHSNSKTRKRRKF